MNGATKNVSFSSFFFRPVYAVFGFHFSNFNSEYPSAVSLVNNNGIWNYKRRQSKSRQSENVNTVPSLFKNSIISFVLIGAEIFIRNSLLNWSIPLLNFVSLPMSQVFCHCLHRKELSRKKRLLSMIYARNPLQYDHQCIDINESIESTHSFTCAAAVRPFSILDLGNFWNRKLSDLCRRLRHSLRFFEILWTHRVILSNTCTFLF